MESAFRMYALGFLRVVLFYSPCYFSVSWTDRLTEEDGFYEWLGALCFLASALFFLALWYFHNKPKSRSSRLGRYSWTFFFFFLLFLFGFGEEISWGQRLFDFDTPEFMAENNMQGETNIHNLSFFHGLTASGARKTGIGAFLNMQALTYIGFSCYLLALPLLSRWSTRFNRLIYILRIPLTPLFIGVFFLMNWVYGNLLRAILTEQDGHSIVEIKESLMAVILLMIPLYFLYWREADAKRVENPE